MDDPISSPGDEYSLEPVEVGDPATDQVVVGRTSHHRIWTARFIAASGLAAGIVLVSVTLLVGVFADALTVQEAKDLAALMLTPLFTLLGTAIAFLFSDQR